MKLLKHIALVCRHKNLVFWYSLKCGIGLLGFLHDFSKFSPTELFESIKYYQGDHSPIVAARRAKGYSAAWLHHKGRNKHHLEYWVDADCEVQPIIPFKYLCECICDKISATKIYRGKEYHDGLPLYLFRKWGNTVPCNPLCNAFIDAVFVDLEKYGLKYILNKKYLKAQYDKICLGKD